MTYSRADLQRAAGISHTPTDLTYDCRMAINGDGPRAYDWADKPHRLVYDLCSAVERLESALRSRIHWIDGEDHCDCGECEALFAALKGTYHD